MPRVWRNSPRILLKRVDKFNPIPYNINIIRKGGIEYEK